MPDERKLTTKEDIQAMRKELARARTVGKYRVRTSNQQVKKIISNVMFTFAIVCLVFLIAQVILVKRSGLTPNIFGYYLYNITTGSMYPTYPTGSILVSHESDPYNLKVGDVVTFYSTSGDRITHRIYSVSQDDDGSISYQTKGDNPSNTVDKELLTPDRVESVTLFKVPFI